MRNLFLDLSRRLREWRGAAGLCCVMAVSCAGWAEAPRVTYVDSLLNTPVSQWSGFERYNAINALMNGTSYARSIVTNVSANTEPHRRYSILSLNLSGQGERFQATVGREDTLHIRGPAYCIFEVLGDGRQLFRSEAIRSNLTAVRVDEYGVKRSVPQEIDIDVRGVRTLQLKTRYASEFTQVARYVHRGEGCVWGMARLTMISSDVSGQFTEGVLRDALRTAAIRTTSALPVSKDGKPLLLGVAGLRLADGKTSVRGADSEARLRQFVCDSVFGMHREGKANIAPLPEADATGLAAALSGDSAARENPQAVLAIARGFRADLLLFGAVVTVSGKQKVTMRLIEVKTGKALSDITLPLSEETTR